MKSIPKALALAVALAAATLTHASPVTVSSGETFSISMTPSGHASGLMFAGGAATLEFSNGSGVMGGVNGRHAGGVVGLFNVGRFTESHLEEASVTEYAEPGGSRARLEVASPVGAISTDERTGQLTGGTFQGGFEVDAPPTPGLVLGGHLTVRHLRADLVGKLIYADLYGQALLLDGTQDEFKVSLNTPVWSITDIIGPSVIDQGVTQSMTTVLRGLRVTEPGLDFVSQALGLKDNALGLYVLKDVNNGTDGWGSMAVHLVFAQAPIPEPATWPLMSLGVIGMVAARRRAMQR